LLQLLLQGAVGSGHLLQLLLLGVTLLSQPARHHHELLRAASRSSSTNKGTSISTKQQLCNQQH
jgi:hypothetical protein